MTGQELARAWKAWIESPEGRSCADIESLKAPPEMREYLRNRLWHAFTVGARVAELAEVNAALAQEGGTQSHTGGSGES